MKLLAFESSAKAASVALWADGVLVAESFQNNGKTHSATLMPMAERLLQDCGTKAADLDYVAVAKGPGSFTGVRIGVAAAKGLAWAAEKPMVGVSTLEGMAHQLLGVQGVICPVMDARRQQVYNALFDCDGETLTRRTPDRAISLEDLKKELEKVEKSIFLVGDGSKLCYNSLKADLPNLIFPPAHLEMQHASGVAMAAAALAAQGETVSAADLVPNYLRLSQAERERLHQQNPDNDKLKGDS
jgi:tRNA threonylcarbamoyladenosine biosynthesis protein TsaB